MASIEFFPVGNGDMTLITTDGGRRILIDLNIRKEADDPESPTFDVASALRTRLERDTEDRLYLDALLVSHPDKDHCRGLEKHFHLGPPGQWSKVADKIFVRQLWSSPMVFRRASKRLTLCDDAKAFNREARRRVKRFRETSGVVVDGDRIRILGEDEKGKTNDLDAIVTPVDCSFNDVGGSPDVSVSVLLLGPLPSADTDEEDVLSKNNSSTILRFSLSGGKVRNWCRYLTGGDAGVAIWERLWEEHGSTQVDWLSFDILLSPHHCSWHSLSSESWSGSGGNAKPNEEARSALSQARTGATIVASSKAIKDDGADPPCIGAKKEYESIVEGRDGSFRCVGEKPSEESPGIMKFEIGRDGYRIATEAAAAVSPAIFSIGRQPQPHG